MWRFINAFKMFIWAIRHPKLMNQNNFKLMSDLLTMIFKVAEDKRPYMSRVAFFHNESKTENHIVSIWAGPSIASDPTKRIEELIKENNILKASLNEKLKDSQNL